MGGVEERQQRRRTHMSRDHSPEERLLNDGDAAQPVLRADPDCVCRGWPAGLLQTETERERKLERQRQRARRGWCFRLLTTRVLTVVTTLMLRC